MKDIIGYEGLYAVTQDGKVWSYPKERSSKNGMFLKPFKMKNGYLIISLCKDSVKRYLVHRLIATAYLTNADLLPQVNHINGNRSDNRVANLEWVNNSGNMQNAIKRGSFDRKGSKHPLSKLTEKKVARIKKLLEEGKLNQRQIAKVYGVTFGLINQIHKGGIWKHVL